MKTSPDPNSEDIYWDMAFEIDERVEYLIHEERDFICGLLDMYVEEFTLSQDDKTRIKDIHQRTVSP